MTLTTRDDHSRVVAIIRDDAPDTTIHQSPNPPISHTISRQSGDASEDLQVVIWDITSHFRPFLDQLIGHYSSLWGIMTDYHVECPISSFLYVNRT